MKKYRIKTSNLRSINWFSKSKDNTLFLIIYIILITFISDNYFLDNQLFLCLFLSGLVSNTIISLAIPKLKELKFKQIIREEGPKEHFSKQGTPTLGGMLMIPIGIIFGILSNIYSLAIEPVLAICFLTFLYMLIGVLDDWISLKNERSLGLKSKDKLILQIIAGITFLYSSGTNKWIDSTINLWFDSAINFDYLIWPFALFVLIAESNSSNLTDGLDGLAAGCGCIIYTGLAIHLTLENNHVDLALAKFCICMAGALIGFLWLNKKPAKIFMGDSGSLALGGSLAAVALISNQLWALLLMGGVFLAESISVIIQVVIFKASKKIKGSGHRVFLMTPIHHHFELLGVKEHIIVRNCWLITIFLVVLSFLF